MPNLGRSVHLATLLPDWNSEKEKGDQAIRVWASQYLNIEMGVGMKTDGWPGAEFWARSEDDSITLEEIQRAARRSWSGSTAAASTICSG
jgi:phage terminase large subunit-like protein